MVNEFHLGTYQATKEYHLYEVNELAEKHKVYCKVFYPSVVAAGVQTIIYGHVIDDAITRALISDEEIQAAMNAQKEVQQEH